MKQCFITGGGSKFGSLITGSLLKAGYHVHLLTSNTQAWLQVNNVTAIPIDWQTVQLSQLKQLIPRVATLDLIFFNHNSSALNNDKFKKSSIQNFKHWQQSYFASCQLPFYLVHMMRHKIQQQTKIAWMLSSLPQQAPDNQIGFADYIGYKSTNHAVMKSFSLNYPACFFGLIPEQNLAEDPDRRADAIVQLVDTTPPQQLNGNTLVV